MKIFDIVVAFLFLVITILILFIPKKILPDMESVQNLLGVICSVLSGLLINMIRIKTKNDLYNRKEK